MFERIYVETTNICNLNCSFCPKTKREKKELSVKEFEYIIEKLKGYTNYLYFHVMGEPLCNENIDKFLLIANEKGFNVNITTNGTLLKKYGNKLFVSNNLKKVFISLHSFEGNDGNNLKEYLDNVWKFCEKRKFIVSLRLWNEGGEDKRNDEIIEYLSKKTGKNINKLFEEKNSITLENNLFLEKAKKFSWPSKNSELKNVNFCHGLISQIAILSNGNVVPCCLDNNGEMTLGNIFESNLEDILSSKRCKDFLDGIKRHCLTEDLCKHCEYATRFTK